jgi:adhesin transport system outer membrane protein
LLCLSIFVNSHSLDTGILGCDSGELAGHLVYVQAMRKSYRDKRLCSTGGGVPMNRYARGIVRGWTAAVATGAIGLGLTLPAQATSIKEAVEMALATNPDIGIVASNREAVDQELRQARGLYLPQLDVRGGLGVGLIDDAATRAAGDGTRSQDMGEVALSLSQPLFDGFVSWSAWPNEIWRCISTSSRRSRPA